ncbi:MAG: FAD/NAD(P)-binding oxidoreductase [Proteobacteria bacterium]|nr:FAD/NAD(P)-binding oxidoreductase [Pseudomonadota bacterium]
MTYVIIGAGPSGVTAADTIRGVDPKGKIVLLSGEPEPPYSRMAIPYVLTNLIKEPGTYLRKDKDHYGAKAIEYQQAAVESVDPKKNTVKLKGGGSLSYDKLLIATGAHPVRPPIDGLDLPGVHHCWTLEDCRNIIRLADKGADVVLMGAGFIGCIILEALAERGVNLTVVEALDRMVPRMMNETAGNMLKAWCENKGVKVLTSTKVTKLESSADKRDTLKVDLDNGQSLPAHLVVVATGVRSNIGFLESVGLKTDVGIIVDNQMRSSVDNIYAAGDCAQGLDFTTGEWAVHAVQPTAVDHGRIAGLNMAGQVAEYKGSVQMNVLDTIGLISASFGKWDGVKGGDHAEAIDAENFRYMRLEFDGERIVGALSLGRTDHVGVLRGLIQTRIRLGEWKQRLIADPHLIAEAYVACSQ